MDTSILASPAASAFNFLKRSTLLLLFLSSFTTPALALQWDIRNLGILPDAQFSTGAALNDLGQVTGNMNYGTVDEGGIPRSIQYVYISAPNGGPLQLIDNSSVIPGIRFYSAAEINNAGQVVGRYLQGSSTHVAFSTAANGGTVINEQAFFQGVDINSSGSAVYQGTFGAVNVVAPDGTSNIIIPSSVPGDVRGINNAGQVAVNLSNEESPDDAFTGAVWTEADGFRHVFADGSPTRLFDINNSGQVLGTLLAPPSGTPLFVIDPDDTVHTLNLSLTGESAAFGSFRLNDSGQVIGVIRDNIGTPTFSFLTSIGTDEIINLSMEEDILAAGWSNIVVSDINNLGQISGTGTINGATRAFLLTPVPEPETYAMMLAGLFMLGFMRGGHKTAHLTKGGKS